VGLWLIQIFSFTYQLLFWTFPNSLLDNAIRLYYIWHMRPSFEWDDVKNEQNKEKHGVSFFDAQYAFADPHRVIIEDLGHSANEDRFFCFGKEAFEKCSISKSGLIWPRSRKAIV